jgi:hypothetical protein
MAGDYSLTLPAAVASTKIMTMDSSGAMAGTYTIDGATLTAPSNVIGVPAGGIGTTQLAATAVTTAKILDSAVTTGKIADANVTTAKLASQAVTAGAIVTNVNLNGATCQMNSRHIMTSNTNATYPLTVVRGDNNSAGTKVTGEGYTTVHTGTGIYTITFTNTFTGTPVAVVGLTSSGNNDTITCASVSTTTLVINSFRSGAATDLGHNFIAIGQHS